MIEKGWTRARIADAYERQIIDRDGIKKLKG